MTVYLIRELSKLSPKLLVMALLDMVGVASIMPFMAVLANPGLVETNALLNSTFTAANRFGITTTQ